MALIDHGWSLLSESEQFQLKGFSRAEEYRSIKGSFKKAGQAMKKVANKAGSEIRKTANKAGKELSKVGDNIKKGFESTAKGINSSFNALGKCNPTDAKCIAKNLGQALKGIAILGFPLYTAVAAEVGGGNVEKGYLMIGKQMYSLSGIEGVVDSCKAIQACGGNAACLAKNIGMLLAGVAAIAANAIPGAGTAASAAATTAKAAARVAEKAIVVANDARKLAKTAQAIRKADAAIQRAQTMMQVAESAGIGGKPLQTAEETRNDFKELNKSLLDIQEEGTSVPPPDYKIPDDAPINTGASVPLMLGAAALGAAAIGGGIYLATRKGGGETSEDAPPDADDLGGGGEGAEGGGAGGGGPSVKLVERPVNINLELTGGDAMFGSSGYSGHAYTFTTAEVLVWVLIICILVVS